MANITQQSVWSELKADAIVWVDPATIHFATGTKHPTRTALIERFGSGASKRMRRAVRIVAKRVVGDEPFVIPERYFGPKRLIVHISKYIKLRDLLDNRQMPQRSLWYKALVNQIDDVGVARHKRIIMRDVADVDRFFEHYVLKLVQSLETAGYDLEKASDFGTAHIDEKGIVTKAGSGNHRFLAAKILGVDRFPLKVAGVHEHWFKMVQQAHGNGLEALKYGIKAAESRHQSQSLK